MLNFFFALSLNNANNAIVFFNKNQKFKMEIENKCIKIKNTNDLFALKKTTHLKKCVEFVVETTQRKNKSPCLFQIYFN